MGVIVVKNAVVRRPGYMYYINGNGDICEAKMATGKTKSKAWNTKWKQNKIKK